MTAEEIIASKKTIDGMTQIQMASLQRFARSGHPYFDTRLPLWEYFKNRFAKLGGMTPEISKAISWD